MSSDFREHATAWLIAEMLESHDRDRFEWFAYSNSLDDGSRTAKRLRRCFSNFRDIGWLDDHAAADRIAADEIDILIDLKGYTKAARPKILALRPAPLQINYLGFPATMGASFIDYIIADEFIVPSDETRHYSEAVIHLPGCYQPNDSRIEIASSLPTRSESQLPEAGFVMGNLGGSYKISPAVFRVWMNLLRAVPDSVLWLLESNRWMADNLRREAARHGIAAERLVFAPFADHPQHLARLTNMDLCLDTFPVSSHTTAGEALRMGVPMIALVGRSFASRVAGSILSALGMPELIAENLGDYESTANRLAVDRKAYAECRAKLVAAVEASPVFDGASYVGPFEKALLHIQNLYQHGCRPTSFRVADL